MASVFEEKKFSKAIIRVGLPAMLGQLTTLIYNIADTFFVSKGMGVVGLTALNLAIPVSQLSTGIVMIVFNFIIYSNLHKVNCSLTRKIQKCKIAENAVKNIKTLLKPRKTAVL